MQVGTKEVWEAFLVAHPTGFYANLARAQRAKLLAAAPAAPTAAAPDPPATALYATRPRAKRAKLLPAAPAAAPAAAPVPTASRPEPEVRGKTIATRNTDSPAARAKQKPAKETAP